MFLFFSVQTEPFQKPVSLEQHPDYAEYIFHPMDLCTLEKVTSFLPNVHINMVRTEITKKHNGKQIKWRQFNVGTSKTRQERTHKML